jgi:2-hydroxychromene-2-carboxylate isomerase
MSQKPKLTLFVDIVSPFAYMAFYVLQRSAAFKQVEITYIPIFLGGVMKACDNRPPISITSMPCHPLPPSPSFDPATASAQKTIKLTRGEKSDKAGYIESDRKRWSQYANIPMAKEMPKGFPPFTLHVMRALAVVEVSQPEKLSDSIAALYKAMWVDAKPIHEPATFESVLVDVLGKEDAQHVVAEVCFSICYQLMGGGVC